MSLQSRLSEFRNADSKLTWLRDQVKWRYFTYRHKQEMQLNVIFDREHDIETADEQQLETVGVPLADVARGNGVYRPVTEKLFRSAVDSIAIDPTKFTFIDIGSGKGKVLFMAASRPFKRILGIEYALGLHEVAVRNCATYRSNSQKCRDIEPVHADALKYDLPPGPLLLFIFNALAKEIMLEFLKAVDERTAADQSRPVILMYTNVRNVAEVGEVFSGLRNLEIIRKARNYVVIANDAGRRLAG
jgi:hypothetical protein